jgi:hypothetical protein
MNTQGPKQEDSTDWTLLLLFAAWVVLVMLSAAIHKL